MKKAIHDAKTCVVMGFPGGLPPTFIPIQDYPSINSVQ